MKSNCNCGCKGVELQIVSNFSYLQCGDVKKALENMGFKPITPGRSDWEYIE